MDNNFEQASEKKFKMVVDGRNAKCTDELGAGRFANYYDEEGSCVARIDQSLCVYEISIEI